MVKIFWPFVGVLIMLCLVQLCTDTSEPVATKKIDNGELDQSFQSLSIVSENILTPQQQYKQAEEQLKADGWSMTDMENGQMPECYNYRPKKGKYSNKLSVEVGSGTDVVIKLVNIETDKCVRFVYINSKTTYEIQNVPVGIYRLKIAYGKNWFSRVQNKKCIGKFLRNPLYEEGTELLDFNVTKTETGISIPSFSLRLDVVSDNQFNTFLSNSITEGQFNM